MGIKISKESIMKRTFFAVAAACLICSPIAQAEEAYKPDIIPADFSATVSNPLFNLPVGKLMVYEGKTEDGLERVEIRIRKDTRKIMGVDTLIYNDRVFVEGQLVEETNDYLAQHRDGSVWYFGELVDNYKDGTFVDHHGGWIAGEDGALPGVWIKGKQVVGDSYRMEFQKGKAEDMAKVVETGVSVTVASGTYKDCTKVYEWTPLEADAKEHKYYCPAAGGQALSEHLTEKTKIELVKVTME
jgi:hypothetical protein